MYKVDFLLVFLRLYRFFQFFDINKTHRIFRTKISTKTIESYLKKTL